MNTSQHLGFRALADPTRRDILILLTQRDMTIAEVADNFQMTRAAVKKHLSILQDGDLITVRTEGRSRINAVHPAGIKHIFDWFGFFESYWDDRLAALKNSIEKDIQ